MLFSKIKFIHNSLKSCDSIYKNDFSIKGSLINFNPPCEDNGLIKIDILSNEELSQLWDKSKKIYIKLIFILRNIYNYLSKGIIINQISKFLIFFI